MCALLRKKVNGQCYFLKLLRKRFQENAELNVNSHIPPEQMDSSFSLPTLSLASKLTKTNIIYEG
jgi:hypothetical protein